MLSAKMLTSRPCSGRAGLALAQKGLGSWLIALDPFCTTAAQSGSLDPEATRVLACYSTPQLQLQDVQTLRQTCRGLREAVETLPDPTWWKVARCDWRAGRTSSAKPASGQAGQVHCRDSPQPDGHPLLAEDEFYSVPYVANNLARQHRSLQAGTMASTILFPTWPVCARLGPEPINSYGEPILDHTTPASSPSCLPAWWHLQPWQVRVALL